MKPEIINIAPKYQTDKNEHGYIKYYAEHLPETANKILEIGVLTGESIRLWHELYPEAKIFGLDLFEENPTPFEDDFVTWFKGSQTDGKLLNTVRLFGPFDFIIEDGSHNSRDQWITFYGLIDCCKLYVAEDLHCAKEEFYRQGMKFEHTMLGQIKTNFNNYRTALSKSFDYEFPFNCELCKDKIAFIR